MQTQVNEPLANLITRASELLDTLNPQGEQREEIEGDIETLQDQSASPTRLKAALRRIGAWAGVAIGSGAASGLSGEVQELSARILNQLT